MSLEILHRRWAVLFSAFYTNFVSYGIRFGYGILLPVMTKSLNLTEAQAGLIVSAYFISYTIFSLIAGALTDRMSAKKVITLFCIALGIGATLMGTVTEQWNACIFYALVGVGASACWTPVATLVQRWFSAKRRGMALGIVTTGYAWGYGTMGLVLPILVSAYGWRTCWCILGALAFSLVAVNGILVKDNPEGTKPRARSSKSVIEPLKYAKPSAKTSYSEVVSASEFWWIGMSYSMIAAAQFVLTTFLVSYATFELSIGYENAATLASVSAFVGVPGALIFPTLSDYVGRRKILFMCNVMVAVSFLSVALIGFTILALMVIVAIWGFFNAGIWPIYAACAPEYFSKALAGTVLGLWTIYYGVGAMIGPAVAGYLAYISKTFFWSFILAALLAAASAVFIFPIPQRGQSTHNLDHSCTFSNKKREI